MEERQDTISRQAAIDAITGYQGVVDKSVAKRILIQLPSAQTEIIHYKDCEYDFKDSRAKRKTSD